jgi:hypothetical protein
VSEFSEPVHSAVVVVTTATTAAPLFSRHPGHGGSGQGEAMRHKGGDMLQARTKPDGSDPYPPMGAPSWRPILPRPVAAIRIFNRVHFEKQFTVRPCHLSGTWEKTELRRRPSPWSRAARW